MKSTLIVLLTLMIGISCAPTTPEANYKIPSGTDDGVPVIESRWSVDKANDYYAAQGWQVGANYNPRSAINQLEMWQAETFNPGQVDQELGWAEDIGMNSMRVYLHNLVWEQDSAGYLVRIERYLDIAERHGISTTFVLFDAVWDPVSELGTQPDPKPHVHNSGWVQSPQSKQLISGEAYYPKGKSFVQGILHHFKDDDRIFMWDLYNEPDNENFGKFPNEPAQKQDYVYNLLIKTFEWAREVNPSQPLTAGVWIGAVIEFPEEKPLGRFSEFQLNNSDLISYHNYNNPTNHRRMIERLHKYGRPLVCTEYVARENGSDFLGILPILHEEKVSAYNWGLVAGKTQTAYPWKSWDSTYTDMPEIWHHEVFWPDGRPFDERETELIEKLSGERE